VTIEAAGQDTSDSRLMAVTANATADTKGSWSEFIASTTNTTYWLSLQSLSNSNDQSFLVDIGVGAASSEVVVIENIPIWCNGNKAESILIPLTIASGSRIAARCQCSTGSEVIELALHLHDDDSYGTSASNITIGADTANSAGTSVDPGGTINTKGSWVELTSSSSADIDWMCIKPSIYLNNNIGDNYHYLIDIGVGGAGSEVVVVSNLYYNHDLGETGFNSNIMLKHTIASGSRIAVRCQASAADAADRDISMAIIGANMTAPAGGGGGLAHSPLESMIIKAAA
jgi:hypothetical protein